MLGLAYRFEPGADDDGVSVVVPLPLLAQLEDRGFDWQVPGLRAELVTGLLRALPKAIRRHVVPAADWAEKFGAELAEQGPESHGGLPPRTLKEALARLIQPLANQLVSAADFDDERVPPHLRMNFRAGRRTRPGGRLGSRPAGAAGAASPPGAQQRGPLDRRAAEVRRQGCPQRR